MSSTEVFLLGAVDVIGILILGGVVSIMTRGFFKTTPWWVVMLAVSGSFSVGCALFLWVDSVRVDS